MNRYKVTLENYEGRCKKMVVFAPGPYEAIAICQRGGWYPVEVVAA